jgi:hypothetical protein
LNTLAIEPDDVLLGERGTGRRLHFVCSLSVQAGLASEDSWDLAAHRLVFDAESAELLCRDIIKACLCIWSQPLLDLRALRQKAYIVRE